MAVVISVPKVEFYALAHLVLVSLRALIWMKKKNIATSEATKCHYIATIVRTLLYNQFCFTDAYLQCHPHPFPMDQRNWLTHHVIQELAHEPKQLRDWPKSLRKTKWSMSEAPLPQAKPLLQIFCITIKRSVPSLWF